MPQNSNQIDSTIQIVTPENIAFEYRVAGPFRRLPAFLIDFAIRVAIWLGVMLLLGALSPLLGGGLTSAFGLVLLFLMEWFYGGIFETFMNGQTPGKWAMGLRVLTIEGQPISGLQAVMRNILRAVDTMPWMSLQAFGEDVPVYILPLFTLGLATMALNQRFQRLGDLVCGTMVVIEERTWLRGVLKLEDPRAAQLASLLPASLEMSRSLTRTLALYVDRRDRLPVGRRRELARHVAEPLLRKFQLPADTSYDLLLCAMYHRAFVTDSTSNGSDTRPTEQPPAIEVGDVEGIASYVVPPPTVEVETTK